MRRARLALCGTAILLLAGCGGKPATAPPPGVKPPPEGAAPGAVPGETPPPEEGGVLQAPGATAQPLPCAARLAALPEAQDAAARASIFIAALDPAPPAAEAGCLFPVADRYAAAERDPLARASAALLAARLSGRREDDDRFVEDQPDSAPDYRPFALRPDLYEPQQDRLLALAASGHAGATEKLLRSLYFRDTRLQDRLLPRLPEIANRQPAVFFAALGRLDGGGAAFVLTALRDRDLGAFRSFLKAVKGDDAERAQKFLARLAAPAPPQAKPDAH